MGYRMLLQLSTNPAPSSAVESQRMVEVLKAGGNKGQGGGKNLLRGCHQSRL